MNLTEGQEWSHRQDSGPVAAAGREETCGHSRRLMATGEAVLAGRCQAAQGLSLGLPGELGGVELRGRGPSVCSQLIHRAIHRNQHHTVEQCSSN